jgi:hypothetical protein
MNNHYSNYACRESSFVIISSSHLMQFQVIYLPSGYVRMPIATYRNVYHGAWLRVYAAAKLTSHTVLKLTSPCPLYQQLER